MAPCSCSGLALDLSACSVDAFNDNSEGLRTIEWANHKQITSGIIPTNIGHILWQVVLLESPNLLKLCK